MFGWTRTLKGFSRLARFGETIGGRSREGAAIYSQPGKQGTSLVGREGVDFKHGHGMGTNRFLSETKNRELWIGMREKLQGPMVGQRYLWEFPSKSLMKLSCELSFFLVTSVEIDYAQMDEWGSAGGSLRCLP